MNEEKEIRSEMPKSADDRLLEMAAACIAEQDAEHFAALHVDDVDESVHFSRKFKIKINRLFRERLRSDHAIYPEVDNVYERLRSKLLIKILDRKEYKKSKPNISF